MTSRTTECYADELTMTANELHFRVLGAGWFRVSMAVLLQLERYPSCNTQFCFHPNLHLIWLSLIGFALEVMVDVV